MARRKKFQDLIWLAVTRCQRYGIELTPKERYLSDDYIAGVARIETTETMRISNKTYTEYLYRIMAKGGIITNAATWPSRAFLRRHIERFDAVAHEAERPLDMSTNYHTMRLPVVTTSFVQTDIIEFEAWTDSMRERYKQ